MREKRQKATAASRNRASSGCATHSTHTDDRTLGSLLPFELLGRLASQNAEFVAVGVSSLLSTLLSVSDVCGVVDTAP